MATKEEVRKGHIVSAVCGVLCISMVGGFIYYTHKPDPYPERIVDMEETVDEEYQKIIDNMKITPKEQALIDANTIKETVEDVKENIQNKVGSFVEGITSKISSKSADTENTGFDKSGNPYLKKGASYTFKPTGEPVEAPTNGNYVEVVSPINNVKYAYNNFNQEWDVYVLDEVKARSRAEARGEINRAGQTNIRQLTDEEAENISKQGWKANIGTLGY